MDRRTSIITRIFASVEIRGETECWPWLGQDSGTGRGGGYPRMTLEGQTVAVHRVLYTHFHGFIPSKKQIDHTCENRSCLNPDHLELVTHKQNQKRKSGRRRKASAGLASSIAQQIDLEEWLKLADKSDNPQCLLMSPETFLRLGGDPAILEKPHDDGSMEGPAETGGGDGGAPAGAGEADCLPSGSSS